MLYGANTSPIYDMDTHIPCVKMNIPYTSSSVYISSLTNVYVRPIYNEIHLPTTWSYTSSPDTPCSQRSTLTITSSKEGTTAIVDKYRNLLKKTKEARVEQIILSGILPVFGNRIDGYRNSKRMAINGMVKRLCKEEDVGYVDLWDSFVGKEEMYLRDGLHLSGKGAAVFAEGLSGAVASGLGKV